MRRSASDRRSYRFGRFELVAASGELWKDGAPVRLQDKPLHVLLLLLEHRGELTSREDLKQRLWPADTFVDFETGLNTAVSKLRDALDDSADNPVYIQTLPRRGYRFVCPLETDDVADDAPQVSRSSSVPGLPSVSRWAMLGAVIAASTLLAILAGWLPTGAPTPSPEVRSIAVAPFTAAPGASIEDYLVDGMTDGLITELAYLTSVTVFPRSAVARVLQTKGAASDIARVLGADVLVRGTLRRDHGRVRMTAELVDAKAGRPLWTTSYRSSDENLLNLQRELAIAVIQHLRLGTTTGEQARRERTSAVPAAAYLAYLKGRFHHNQVTEEGSWRAIASFQEAIASAPDYAPAYAALARAYRHLHHVRPPAEISAKTRAAVTKALDLDPELAEAHSVLAELEMEDLQWVRAEAAHRRAIALNPSDPMAQVNYAAFLSQAERHDQALVAVRRAETLDPLSPFIAANVILRLNSLGQFEEGLAQAHKALRLDPNFWLAHQWMGGAYCGGRHRLTPCPRHRA